jgi:hypothetical protein
MTENNSFPMHYYPDYILMDSFSDRKVDLIVKVNETLSGNVEELEKIYQKSEDDAKKVLEKNGNIWGSTTNKPTDINTTPVINNTKRLQNAKPIYAITLPLPNELNDVQAHTWETENGIVSTMLGSMLDTAKNAAKGNLQPNGSASEGAGSIEKKIVGGAHAVLSKANGVVDAVVNSSGKIIANASSAMGFRKPLVDPGFFANYQGTRPRVFNMSFDFIPNNENEANNILNIIINLKKFSLPTTAVNGVMLMAPYTFEIIFGNKRLERLINLSNVALQSLEVNYSADGTMQMFGNGMPKYIRVSMQFLECNVVTSEFY